MSCSAKQAQLMPGSRRSLVSSRLPDDISRLTLHPVSPDSKLVAAGSLDTIVRVWDTRTGQQVERLRGHKDSVYSVAFSPAGDSLVSGSLDKSLKVWDLRQTKLAAERAQPGHPSPTGLGVLQQTLVGHKVSPRIPPSSVTLTACRTTCSRSVPRRTAHGSCPDPRTAVYNSGGQTDRRNFCCRGTRIQASRIVRIAILSHANPPPQSSRSTWPRVEICLRAAVATVMREFGNIRMYSDGCIIWEPARSVIFVAYTAAAVRAGFSLAG